VKFGNLQRPEFGEMVVSETYGVTKNILSEGALRGVRHKPQLLSQAMLGPQLRYLRTLNA
jgi:hypothetical protein